MPKTLLTSGALLLMSGCIFGQENLTFEVASIKPSAPPDASGRVRIGPPRGGPGTSDPGQITWSNAPLISVVEAAYDKQLYQVTAPDWMVMARFDFNVKVPPGATKEQVAIMWRNLLKERFGMVAHHESKEFSVWELTVAKGGPKLKATELPASAEPFTGAGGPVKLDANGFPQFEGTGMVSMTNMNQGNLASHLTARAQTMRDFVSRLSQMMATPVTDKTGLTGRYDFNLEYVPDPSTLPPPPPGPPGAVPPPPPAEATAPGGNLESAVEKQLGLKLSKGKGMLDVIVVDHAEKTPTQN